MAKSQAFITLRDHKDNFENTAPYRLINLAKSNMGLVSKQILERINDQVRLTCQLSHPVEKFTNQYTAISQQDHATIAHARKSLLFYHQELWRKTNNSSQFDVTKGSFDGIEVCEIVRCTFFTCRQTNSTTTISDCTETGFTNIGPRTTNRIRNKLHDTCNKLAFKITAQANLEAVHVLDITLELNN